MQIKVEVDGVVAVVDCAPYGRPENKDDFVNANIVPVAHIAMNLWLEKKGRTGKQDGKDRDLPAV